MDDATRDELRQIIRDELSKGGMHPCKLTKEQMQAVEVTSNLFLRIRNAAGNFIMVLILVVAVMGIGGILYLLSAGHINVFRMFGVGA
jgi:uncharacterized phage infection (PIP) family protein YhgE